MRPLPAWPTKTFQSPKLATSAGLAESPVSPLSVFFEAASAGAKAPARATAHRAKPAGARRDRERRDHEWRDNPENLMTCVLRPRPPRAPRGPKPSAALADGSGRNSGLRLCGLAQSL